MTAQRDLFTEAPIYRNMDRAKEEFGHLIGRPAEGEAMSDTHIVLLSGGLASWLAAKRVSQKYGTNRLKLLYTDTRFESDGLYRFLDAAVRNVGGEYIKLTDGRDPWQVFRDVRFLGNSRIDPCSRILKRELSNSWIKKNYTPETAVLYFGLDWTEGHRLEAIRANWSGWRVEAPLMDPPELEKDDMAAAARAEGLPVSEMYELGFSHDNCGGRCIKAGQAHYAKLLRVLPSVYADVENREREFCQFIGKTATILRDRSSGDSRPMTLGEFRERLESGWQYDLFDYGACSCFWNMEDGNHISESSMEPQP